MSDSFESPSALASAPLGMGTRLCFTLNHWCLWQSVPTSGPDCWPGGEVLPYNDGNADVSFLPVVQRRRLSPLARAVCAVVWRCRHEGLDMPTVFFSSHGESQYYFEMLEGMADGERVSPIRFSQCVHNAIAGQVSIYTESFLPYVCLAGGSEGMFAAFLEAAGMLLEVPQVLVVWYEQPLPNAYSNYLTTPDITWALAMILTRSGGHGHQLRLEREPAPGPAAEDKAGTSLMQAILDGQRRASCRLEHSLWRWSLDDD